MLSDVATMHAVCLAGYGIAQVLELGVDAHLSSGRLVILFPDWEEERFPRMPTILAPIPRTEDARVS
jgi:DNA-binding transcriptional LysR family regulator